MDKLAKRRINNLTKYADPVPPASFNYAINISLKYKYLYTETPKVACSTIKSILQRMELEDPNYHWHDFEDIHRRQLSPLVSPLQIGNFDQLLEKKDIFKFCFSRNPYSRLLSVYLEKVCSSNQDIKNNLSQHSNLPLIDQHISFDRFIGLICEQEVSQMDPHWRTQYYQTFQPSFTYDFIGKLETFPRDLHYALERVSANYSDYVTTERRHAKHASDQLTEYYTQELARKVKTKFSIDFEYFDYPEEIRYANADV